VVGDPDRITQLCCFTAALLAAEQPVRPHALELLLALVEAHAAASEDVIGTCLSAACQMGHDEWQFWAASRLGLQQYEVFPC